MDPHDCENKVRFSLSDKSGVLRFEAFDIVDQPQCRSVLEKLRAAVLGRALTEIDLGEIKAMSCPHGDHCMRAVAKVIKDCQDTFSHRG